MTYIATNPDFSNDFEKWHSRYPWVPRLNQRKHDVVARALFFNMQTRNWVEMIKDPSQGEKILSALKARRADMHIPRHITTKNAPELSLFTVGYIDFLSVDTEQRVSMIDECIPPSMHANAASQFWTVAPYIYSSLVAEQKLTSELAFTTLLEWSKSRVAEITSGSIDACYPGLGNLSEDVRFNWKLSSDGRGFSHSIARNVGKFIAEQLAARMQSADAIST